MNTAENEVTLAEMKAAHSFGASYPFCGYRTLRPGTGLFAGKTMESICIEPVGHDPDHAPTDA